MRVAAATGWALLLALLAFGCSNGEEERLTDRQLQRLVLQPRDLPAVFTRFDEGPLSFGDFRPGQREDPQRYGRSGGWKARFRRPGSPTTGGPLVVESQVDAFEGPTGAERDLAAYRSDLQELASAAGGRLLPVPRLGEQALGIELTQDIGATRVRFFTVAWRQGRLSAAVTVNGFAGRVSLEDALALGRRQDARIEAALRG